MSSLPADVTWNEGYTDFHVLFIGFIQIFTEKIVTTMNTTILIA